MRSREYLGQFKQTLQERLDETTDPQMRSFYRETLESAQSKLDQLAAEEQQGTRTRRCGIIASCTRASHREKRSAITSCSPRRSLLKRSATELCVKASITASCEINKRKESEHG
jgi:hypothetical protein